MTLNYSELLEALRAQIETGADTAVVVGALPPNGGVALVPGGGTVNRYMDGGALLKLSVAVNSKAHEQLAALELHTAAHDVALNGSHPQTDAWQVTGVSVRRAPVLLGQDSAGWWMYGSTLEVRAYFAAEV